MKKWQGYKIAVLILAAVVIIETALVIYLWLGRPRKIAKKPLRVEGKIAIVIDDWGYNLNNLYILDQIKYPLTMSILPDLAYSRTIAAMLNKRGIEVILHLPMEPREKIRLEKDTILTTMDGPAIRGIINRDLDDIYYAKGVSNHMGSKATEDSRTMTIVFEELKKRNLFFLDSFVSPKTVCFPLARKMRIGFARRDVFLDNKEEPGYIKQQIYKLKARAKAYGEAIGIGHDRQVTLEVLKEVMPELEKQGYKFVFLSELIK
ncbi:MAG: divergent polysaccharide deacetylase family protein [Candidatus Omnitrophica bacterium]|nr:divergent polysaccharide deacetylase family protein [Candidatus Omnitrophota bacterium]MDD5592580.1 divergent polysaccharide deacetylase family protein [Candidatus Omnitrophota bacterium]